MLKKREFTLSKEAFVYMKILANRCGIDLDDYRQQALYNRLVKRLRVLNLPNFDDYCNLLRIDIEEEIKFINLMTNSTTDFFREDYHFSYLAQHVLPELVASKNKIRIWSAACSTGQEAYSIAMVVADCIPDLAAYDIKILATDINSDSLNIAINGRYPLDSIKNVPVTKKNKWFHLINDEEVEVSDTLKKMISFKSLNLMGAWPMQGRFDVIFCRNVLIYFKHEIVQRLLHHFDNHLLQGGTFFLGHAENLYDIKNKYQAIGKTIYKKLY